MKHTGQRERLRAAFAGTECIAPASIFDPLSARVAESVGYKFGQVGGSVASQAILAAPDLVLMTLTEFADLLRRIMRVSDLSVFVDADHGYGNALNVMRTIQELEHAGIAGLTIEDTVLPRAFGQAKGEERLISIEEGVGKMRAALAARSDPSFVMAARTSALRIEGIAGALARVKAYAACGVDALFFEGLEKLDDLKAIHDAVKLPIIMGNNRAGIKREDLEANGTRMLLVGHLGIVAAVKALQEVYTHLFNGGSPADLKSKIASPDVMKQLTQDAQYQKSLRDFMEG